VCRRAQRFQCGRISGSQICGRSFAGTATPPAFVRITVETAPNWIHRTSSSGVSSFVPSEKNPPTSEPQVETPDSPIVSAL
jgi:hypothetical protein